MVDTIPSAAVLVVEKFRLHLLRLDEELADTAAQDLAKVEAELAGDAGRYRQRLIQLLALNEAETDALDCAVACAVEPALGQAFAQLQGSSGASNTDIGPSEIGLRLVLAHGPAPIAHRGSPLLQWGLITTKVGAPHAVLYPDPAIVDWYFGRMTAGPVPLRKPDAVEPLPEWQHEKHAHRLNALLKEKRPTRLSIHGAKGTGRTSLAQSIAKAMGKQALLIDPALVASDHDGTLFLWLQRMALLGDIALIWRGAVPHWPSHLPVSMLHFVTLDVSETCPEHTGLVDLSIEMPELSSESRARLCQQFLPHCADQLTAQMSRPRIGDLAEAAAQGITQVDEFRDFYRRRNIARTGNIGRIEAPSFGWDDLVLERSTLESLRDFAAEARLRDALFDDPERERMLGGNAHLTALFSGSPGLGKSMSAKVIAAELGIDLLVIDYANLSSKYIGETAKRLSETFRVARETQCALLFDEADTLFASRTKVETANDRHGNADTGHLLQLIESHRGVVMLSTNKRGNIDPAMTRRLRFIVEFKKPKLAERQLLWQRMLSLFDMTPDAQAQLVAQIAPAHELTPAQIKGAALTAAYCAMGEDREIEARDVEHGIRSEFLKDGRLLSSISKPGRQKERVRHGA